MIKVGLLFSTHLIIDHEALFNSFPSDTSLLLLLQCSFFFCGSLIGSLFEPDPDFPEWLYFSVELILRF